MSEIFNNKRGFFAVGVEFISKVHNAAAIFRTTHAFGGDFMFSISPKINLKDVNKVDTSKSSRHVPLFTYNKFSEVQLPHNCKLISVELTQDATEISNFLHPLNAAYIFGPEKGSVSKEIIDKSDYVIKIPTKFCINVSVACAIVLYDRYMKRKYNI